MIVGIDGSNILTGGGVTHLRSLLEVAAPSDHDIERMIVWGSRQLLGSLPEREWLERQHEPWLDRALPARLLWQQIRLPLLARRHCDLLFAPGGSTPHRFSPVVTMSRTMLPFEPRERGRYGWSGTGIRLRLLGLGQACSFRRADGLIFLTDYAREIVTRVAPRRTGIAVIPHGINDRFRIAPRPQRPIEDHSPDDPLKVLYVSIVDLYKHHVPVADAVARLRQEGLPLVADFLGPAYPPALRRFRAALRALDPEETFLRYRGPVPHAELPEWYREADVFVFASSCENMPNILLEGMAAGLPVASSERGPMPEVLAGSGELFDPECPESIADALRRLVSDAELRRCRARAAYERAFEFRWERCASETLAFLRATWVDAVARGEGRG